MMTICLLGASGSIGQQTIEVMLNNAQDFDLLAFSVGKRTRCIPHIIKRFPNIKAICVQEHQVAEKLQNKYTDILFYSGDNGLESLIKNTEAKMVVNALVGFVGLRPSITALSKNKILCLANKESLVVGGEIINDLLKKKHGKLIPIDSEHVAIKKCLDVDSKDVDRIVITASGGPFRNLKREDLANVTPEQALAHPNWKMGNKITIDSATMVNKTFEIIEAHYLFNYLYEDIDILLNYNSYVHSLVHYKDGNYRFDYGKPDMRVPIKYALYQGLTPYQTMVTKNLNKIKNTSFGEFDIKRFPIVKTAKKVIDQKGLLGAIFNASNEVAVAAFLNHEISFLGIEKLINDCLKKTKNKARPNYFELKQADLETRELARKLIEKGGY